MKTNSNSRSAFFVLRLALGLVLFSGGLILAIAGLGKSVTGTIARPASGSWTETGDLATARDIHTATLLSDGKVLVAGGGGNGGSVLASAELYDPGIAAIK